MPGCPLTQALSAGRLSLQPVLSPVSQIRDLPELISSLLIAANKTRGALALALLHYTHAKSSPCPQGTIVRVFCISQHVAAAPCGLKLQLVSERNLCKQSPQVTEGTLSALFMHSVCLEMLPEPGSKGTVEEKHSSGFPSSFKSCGYRS